MGKELGYIGLESSFSKRLFQEMPKYIKQCKICPLFKLRKRSFNYMYWKQQNIILENNKTIKLHARKAFMLFSWPVIA